MSQEPKTIDQLFAALREAELPPHTLDYLEEWDLLGQAYVWPSDNCVRVVASDGAMLVFGFATDERGNPSDGWDYNFLDLDEEGEPISDGDWAPDWDYMLAEIRDFLSKGVGQ